MWWLKIGQKKSAGVADIKVVQLFYGTYKKTGLPGFQRVVFWKGFTDVESSPPAPDIIISAPNTLNLGQYIFWTKLFVQLTYQQGIFAHHPLLLI